MAGSPWDPSVRWDALARYIEGTDSLAVLAKSFGVPESTMEKWSAEDGWPERRRRYRQTLTENVENEAIGQQMLLQKIVTDGNPMAAFGYSSIVGTCLKRREIALKEREAGRTASPARTFASLDEAKVALSEAITARLGAVLAEPGALDLKTVKVLREALDLAGSLSGKAGEDKAGKGKPKQLDPETLKAIREQIYGLI